MGEREGGASIPTSCEVLCIILIIFLFRSLRRLFQKPPTLHTAADLARFTLKENQTNTEYINLVPQHAAAVDWFEYVIRVSSIPVLLLKHLP